MSQEIQRCAVRFRFFPQYEVVAMTELSIIWADLTKIHLVSRRQVQEKFTMRLENSQIFGTKMTP